MMPTSSFTKSFRVEGKSAKQLKKSLAAPPTKTRISLRPLKEESRRGIALLLK